MSKILSTSLALAAALITEPAFAQDQQRVPSITAHLSQSYNGRRIAACMMMTGGDGSQVMVVMLQKPDRAQGKIDLTTLQGASRAYTMRNKETAFYASHGDRAAAGWKNMVLHKAGDDYRGLKTKSPFTKRDRDEFFRLEKDAMGACGIGKGSLRIVNTIPSMPDTGIEEIADHIIKAAKDALDQADPEVEAPVRTAPKPSDGIRYRTSLDPARLLF
ncbi:MAG: hypothetical protein WAO98_05990 [Alphaproteobacteria bacterium]